MSDTFTQIENELTCGVINRAQAHKRLRAIGIDPVDVAGEIEIAEHIARSETWH